jgi:hypothetical protein|uniref:Uncharacterized protein n=1 Tax=Phaeodactylum tricornutum TaxID=2850 RepID=A0A8J9TFW6_PHATR
MPQSTIPSAPSRRSASSTYDPALVQALFEQAYHLPGNDTAFQDWLAYMGNNHPILGLCLAHPAHPATRATRLLMLLASVTFGLVITNIFYLTWIYYEEDYEVELLALNTTTGVQLVDNTYGSVQVTTGMLILWFIGGMVHGVFDHVLWCMATGIFPCSGFPNVAKRSNNNNNNSNHTKGRERNWTLYIMIVIVMVSTAIATLGVVLNSAMNAEDRIDDVAQRAPAETLNSVDGAEVGEFMLGFALELVMAYVLYFPLGETILFTGILSCNGRLPMFAGRPQEIEQLREQQRPQAKTKSLQTESRIQSKQSAV